MVAIGLFGTTQDSQVTISSLGAHAHESNSPLPIASINVHTRRLGSIQGLTTADIDGRITPLTGPIASLQFDAIGSAAQIDVNGNLGQLTVNRTVNLGKTGHINVTNDLTGAFSVTRDVALDGGQITVGRDLSGTVSIGGNLTVDDGGQFSVMRNLGGSAASPSSSATAGATTGASTGSSSGPAAAPSGGGGATITGNLTLDSNGKLMVSGNASSLSVGGNLEASSGGQLMVAGNLGSLTVNGGGGASITGNLTLNPGGAFLISRNLGSLNVGSNLQVFQGSQFQVAGNLTSLSVGGNLETSQSPPQTSQGNPQTTPGGEVLVQGNLGTLSVTGVVQGKGSEDIVVGDDLGQLTVLGGGHGVQGLQGVDLDVTKNLQGLDVRNGISDSLITAGILISGGTPGTGSNGWNIGPDGSVAVLDSQIRAGFEIMNLTIGGDVKSDLPANPTSGRVTRIVAGEDAAGNFAPGGIIDNFQIVGNLIDSVLAASVAPSQGFYHQPAGAIEVGVVGGLITTLPTYTAPPFANTPDIVLPNGSINPSFAAPLQLVPPAAPAGTKLPLPSKPTVLGSVITTSPHVDGTDYAGIFAANTNGVIVGPLPTSAPVVPA
jgi:hypothetical protein